MKKIFVLSLMTFLLFCGTVGAATDGAYTKTSPTYPTQDASDAFDEIKENFEFLERAFFIEEILMLNGYYIDYTYTSGNITAMTVKNSSGVSQGTAAITYSGSNISTVAWTINSKTLTYTYTYSGGNITRVTLAITP